MSWDAHLRAESETITKRLVAVIYRLDIASVKACLPLPCFPLTNTTNSSLFTALPSGYRNNGGNFGSIGNYGYWWTSTELNSIDAYYKGMYSNSESISTNNSNKKLGLSIRCIKD